jgi:hypothetical protein
VRLEWGEVVRNRVMRMEGSGEEWSAVKRSGGMEIDDS